MLNKGVRRTIGIFLIAIVALTMIVPSQQVHAQTISVEGKDIGVITLSRDKVKVIEGDSVETLELRRTIEGEIQQVIWEDLVGGEKEVITIDSVAHTLHSSLTNQTEKITAKMMSDYGIEPMATGDVHTYKFSFAKIKQEATGINTVTKLAKVLIALLAGIGVTIATPITTIISIIGAGTAIIKGITSGSSAHGVYVKVKEGTRKVTKNGKVYTIPKNDIIAIGTY